MQPLLEAEDFTLALLVELAARPDDLRKTLIECGIAKIGPRERLIVGLEALRA